GPGLRRDDRAKRCPAGREVVAKSGAPRLSRFPAFPVSAGNPPAWYIAMTRVACLLLCLFATSAHAAGWPHVGQIEAPCCFSGSPNGMKFGSVIAADLDTASPPKIRALYVGAPGFSITVDQVVYPEAGI